MLTLWKCKDTECEIKVTLLKCTAVGYFVWCTGRYTELLDRKGKNVQKIIVHLGKKLREEVDYIYYHWQ